MVLIFCIVFYATVQKLFNPNIFFQVSLSLNILLSLTVFFLLLAEIIPPTSLVVPLLGNLKKENIFILTFSISIMFHDGITEMFAPFTFSCSGKLVLFTMILDTFRFVQD